MSWLDIIELIFISLVIIIGFCGMVWVIVKDNKN
nr:MULTISPECIES: hypothetical protein [unclassified Campylobacter]